VASEVDFAQRLSALKSDQYRSLRPWQADALASYATQLDASDLAIELPTGYGKTLVALLIGDLALDRGMSVAYLTGTKQLAEQVLDQAKSLKGLKIVRFSGKNYPPANLAAYNAAKAIGIMNYWTYFNTSPKVEPADLVIFDDAHLAEQPLAALFAIRVERDQSPALYEQMCNLVMSHTDLYTSIELMSEGSAGPTTAPELLAFKHWSAIAGSAVQILNRELPADIRRFVWPIVRPNLAGCGVLIGPSAIEIRPYHPPTQTLAGYRRARQCLYLSATLGSMDDLQRRLGVRPVTSIISNVQAGQVGERVFILNPSDESTLSEGTTAFAFENAAAAGRAAWLCASHSEADAIESLVKARRLKTYRLQSGGEDDVLERWRLDGVGHLVTAGRYDGLDFAGDLCRLVIIPSVPAASTEFERFVMAYLCDATYMRHRVAQRVTQALGRANRRDGDWAMYLGLSPSFGMSMAHSAVQAEIPSEVQPVVEAALVRMQRGWAGAANDAQEFWKTHKVPGTLATPETERLRPGRSRAAATAGSASDEVSAATALWIGDYAGAAQAAARAAETLATAGEVEHAAFWRYVQAQALSVDDSAIGNGRAIEALRAAVDGGSRTAWFVRLSRVLTELRGEQAARVSDAPWETWDEWLRERGPKGVLTAVDLCRSRLAGTHDQQAEALEILGRIVGVASSRPMGPGVTDVVWSWTSARGIEKRLWEIKTGSPDRIPRDWVDQALGQLASESVGPKRRTIAGIISAITSVDPTASNAASDLCLWHTDVLIGLVDGMSDRLLHYASRWGPGAMERGLARDLVERRLPKMGWLEQVSAPTGAKVLRKAEVVGLFE
jgi:hypothetical protein